MLRTYFTMYPTSQFFAGSDAEALASTTAPVVYRQGFAKPGMVFIRDTTKPKPPYEANRPFHWGRWVD